MKKARLLFTEKCNRNCEGCCNKNWKGTPAKEITFEELLEFDEINITGGEPMLFIDSLTELILKLKRHWKIVYLYTATPKLLAKYPGIMFMVDGISLTLHDYDDYLSFNNLGLNYMMIQGKSLRLNVFPDVKIITKIWDVRPKVWIKDCPLPSDETFVRLKI